MNANALKQAGTVLIGGMTAAIATAIPLVDNGVTASEVLSIVLAGLVGTGLTAVPARAMVTKNSK